MRRKSCWCRIILNIHKPASIYEAFPAPEARRLVERFEWHHTPKHGSWLDMARSELGVLASQCLDRRIADKQILATSYRMAGTPPQQAPRQSRLAIHNRQRPRQAEETVPSVRVTRATSYLGCRLSVVSASASSSRLITIAGNGDHDPLETLITMLWN